MILVVSEWFGIIQVDYGWYGLIQVDKGWFWLILNDSGWIDTGWYGYYGLIMVDYGWTWIWLIWVDSGCWGFVSQSVSELDSLWFSRIKIMVEVLVKDEVVWNWSYVNHIKTLSFKTEFTWNKFRGFVTTFPHHCIVLRKQEKTVFT